MINFLNLRYFVRVAEEKNMTRVAELEHISQQSLSNHIKKIEQHYGVQLFDRTGGLTLTYAGEQIYKYAVSVLSLKHDMESEIQDMTDSEQGTLRIGISYTRGSAFLPEVLPEFCERNPYVKIDVVENNSQVLEEYLLRGHIDLYVGANHRPSSEIKNVELMREKHFLVVPKEISERHGGSTDISNYIAEPFLLLSEGNRIRDMFDEFLRLRNFSVNIRLEGENIETLFSLACRGMGITVYPEMFLEIHGGAEFLNRAPVVLLPMDANIFDSVLYVAYHKKRYLSKAAKCFIELAKEKSKKN